MGRRGVVSLALVLLGWLAAVEAQEPKVPRIGVILGGTLASRLSQLDAFRQGMSDRGYVEGSNIVFEIRAPKSEGDEPFAAGTTTTVSLS
jgi:hypothetical protein